MRTELAAAGSGTGATVWDGETAASLAARLAVPRVVLLDMVTSTQDVAHTLGQEGAPANTVIVVERQTAGRGRQGRAWTSLAGHGVWCTVLARPERPAVLDTLSLRVGLRLAGALDAAAGARVGLKWPNDLVLRDGDRWRKLGGILVEARWNGAALAWVAIGVGINVRRPPDVPDAAALGALARRADVLAAIVAAARGAVAAPPALSAEELAEYASRDALAGRTIVAPAAGRVEGISSSGSLLVHTPTGVTPCRAGTILLEGEEAP